MKRLRKATLAVAATLLLGLAPTLATAPSAAGAVTPASINGGGSSFAALEIDQWRADTARKPYSLKVNYVSEGSSFGRQEFMSGNLDFGASDIIFQDSELPTLQSQRCKGETLADCFVYVPVSAGGLAFMYNLTNSSGQRLTNIQLTRRAACKIFTGAITMWNDPELVATNPELANFDQPIVPIIRGDGAGESYVFSQFCIAVAPDIWQAFIAEREKDDPQDVAQDFAAGDPVSNWPQGWGRSNTSLYADGVANTVADPVTGKNAITYLAAGYAKVRNFPVASLQNAAGVYTQPDEDNVTVALGYATDRGNGTFILNFSGADKRAYFPSTYSYVIAQTAGFDPAKGAALGQYLCYAVSKGQEIAPSLQYARLSSVLVNIAISQIVKIPGAPSAANCPIAGAPPPPAPVTVASGPPPTLPVFTGGGTTLPGSSTNPGGGGGTGGSGPGGAGSPGGTTVPGAGSTGGSGSSATGGTGGSGQSAAGPISDNGSGSNYDPTPISANASAPSGNNDSLWTVLEGAFLCMAGGALASRWRKS